MAVDKDKNLLKSCIGGPSFNEDIKGFSVVEGWDRNIKRKRSVGVTNARILDADRECKLVIQERHVCDPPLKSSGGFTFRSSSREDSFSGKQSHLTKGRSSRIPRPALPSLPTSSPGMPRNFEDLEVREHIQFSNETQLPCAPNIRKRLLPLEPSSPAATQWGGQRQPKSFRARRTNVTSPVSRDGPLSLNEGFLSPDTGSRSASGDPARLSLCKTVSNNSQLNAKTKNSFSPVVSLERDEANVAEVKRKDKIPQNNMGDDATLNVSQKVIEHETRLIKKAVGHEEELGDDIQRHAKAVRVLAQSKSRLPLKGKSGVPEMTKSIQSGRPVSDRSESKAGHSFSRKISDQRTDSHPSSKNAHDFGDDHDELIAAAAYAHYIASMHSFQISSDRTSELFWEKMRPFFAFVSSDQISHLIEMIELAADMDGCFDLDACIKNGVHGRGSLSPEKSNGNLPDSIEHRKHFGIVHSINKLQNVSGQEKLGENRCLEMIIPLSQRLLSAIIPEPETESLSYSTDENLYSKVAQEYANAVNGLICLESEDVKHCLASENGNCLPMKCQSREKFSCHGSTVVSDFWNDSISNDLDTSCLQRNPTEPDSCVMSYPSNTPNNMFDVQNIDEMYTGPSQSDSRYEHMSLDERILLELQSIGICLDIVPGLYDGDDDEIDKIIYELMTRLFGQMGKKKIQLCNLDEATQNQRVLEERSLEQLAMNKLVEMAYGKLMVGRGNHGSVYKVGHNKVSKRAALAFAKRVLAKCHKYENTGKSCFSDLPYREILFSSLISSESKCNSVINCQPTSLLQTLSPCTNSLDRHGIISFQSGINSLNPSKDIGCPQGSAFLGNEKIFDKERKELLLDEVGSASSGALSAPANTLLECLKRKRNEKDRDQCKRVSMRSFTKSARQSLGGSKGERRSKSRSKQETIQTSFYENDPSNCHGAPALLPALSNGGKRGPGSHSAGPVHPTSHTLRLSKEMESPDSLNFSLDMSDELCSQAHDISTWLNVDENSLQDTELMGLEIPMDDLSELDMNF